MGRLFTLILVAILLIVGCSGSKQSDNSPKSGNSDTKPKPPDYQGDYSTPTTEPPKVNPQPVTLTFKLAEFTLDPKEVTVPLGSQVTVKVSNEGERKHDFSLAAYGVESETLDSGKGQELTFKADKAGEFEIICSLKGHKEKGMVAKLIVK